MAVDGFWCYIYVMSVLLAPSFWSCLMVSGEKVALMEVFLRDRQGVSSVLQGEVIDGSFGSKTHNDHEHRDHDPVEGRLRLAEQVDLPQATSTTDVRVEEGVHVSPPVQVQDDELDHEVKSKDEEPWIGVVPVEIKESEVSTSNQESFAAAVVNKMKRALVLGASALIILALNQNTVREMDLSQVLSKPVIVFQTSDNVTKLIGVLLRGLHATARITYKTILHDNLGATLTLWSSCGRSRGGLYGEWQGVICTGETNSQVQKYLQQLWNTVLLVALILCTGVIVQARWQYRDHQLNDDMELLPKQDIMKQLAALKTRKYHLPKTTCDVGQAGEADNCAVCLEQFFNNQCLRVLPCLHEFHRDCVDPWLLLQQTCPLCKRSILSVWSNQKGPLLSDETNGECRLKPYY